MSRESDNSSKLVIAEVISIWKDCDPVEGYAAGFDDCKGRMFIPTDAAEAEILRRIENARSRLAEIQDEDVRSAANKLLSSLSVGTALSSPDQQILACFLAIWYTILKEDHKEAFVKKILDQALEIVLLEHSRWQGQKFTGEKRKACVDACFSLEAVLILLASKNSEPEVVEAILNLSATVTSFCSLFSFPVPRPGGFEKLFEFFEANSGPPAENKLYPQIIDHLFDYGASIEDIYTGSRKMLDEELALAKDVVRRLSDALCIQPDASLGEAYEAVKKRYAINVQVVEEAQEMMKVLNRFIDGNIQDIGERPDLLPEATPEFLKPLITSGAAIALDYLTERPKSHIYVTEEKNTSWLTLLNLLVHEAAHAYSPIILSKAAGVSDLTRLKSWLSLPFYEATAFHRELELFESVRDAAAEKGKLGATLQELLDLFDTPPFPLRDDVIALEFETRIWRIIRALRTICDVEINTGRRTYTEFVKSAAAQTQLSRELIHNECFPFLSYPGYMLSYSFCGSQYQELQQKAAKERNVSRLSFNTQANQMGLLPWTLCVKAMNQFGPT